MEHRYAHEYGEVSVTMPTAPITPRSGRPNSARKVVQKGDTFTSPKDLFEKALQNSNKTFVVPQSSQSTEVNGPKEPNILVSSAYDNPKDLFEQALNSSKNSNSSNSASSKKGALTVANSQGLSNGLPVLDKLGKRYGVYRALDKLYFQKSTVLVHFFKKGVTKKFLEYCLFILKTYTKKR